jgi:mannosylglycerate hydrolase
VFEPTLQAVLVEHSHLDREWYRTAERFRGRLVEALDDVLDALDQSERVFTLDGQVVVLEDYLELRPGRAEQARRLIQAGQLVIGPWYVQADGLIPSDELIIRNLQQGALAAAKYGPTSRVGYLPDTFGHPAQLPMILAGAGLTSFCFSRGSVPADLPDQFQFTASDGSSILALRLRGGYSNAAHLPKDDLEAGRRLAEVVADMAQHGAGEMSILMAGHDHVLPRDLTKALLVAQEHGVSIRAGSIQDAADAFAGRNLPAHRGEIRIGGKNPILQDVLSTRVSLKLANARAESGLVRVAEPLAAAAVLFDVDPEAAALRLARRELLHNHAHDSLCGTSIDPVHREMAIRFLRVEERLDEAAGRILGQLAGDRTSRPGDLANDQVTLAIFNPHATTWTGPVDLWFDADPPYIVTPEGRPDLPPLLAASERAVGFNVDGVPARIMRRPNLTRFSWSNDADDRGLQFVVTDLAPMAWTKVTVSVADRQEAVITDDVPTIEAGDLRVAVAGDGRFTVTAGDRAWHDLMGLRDEGDAGDSYDAGIVGDAVTTDQLISITRHRHENGLQRLIVRRRCMVPASLKEGSFRERSEEMVALEIELEASLWPGADRIPVTVRMDNTARDHRLRLVFPLAGGDPVSGGPFDVITRSLDGGPLDPMPVHRHATRAGSGLAVSSPGLLEWSADQDGLAVTLVRSTGWLSHDVHPDRGGPLGPNMRTPDGQEPGAIEAVVTLIPTNSDPERERIAGLAHANPSARVVSGDHRWTPDTSLVEVIASDDVTLTSVKPADDGNGIVVRVWNRGGSAAKARVRCALPVTAAMLTDLLERDVEPATLEQGDPVLDIAAHGICTVRIQTR